MHRVVRPYVRQCNSQIARHFTAGITKEKVAEIRNMTGASIGSCRKALLNSDGDICSAVRILRAESVCVGLSKSARHTRANLIGTHTHTHAHTHTHTHLHTIALLELRCETDFVTKQTILHTLVAEAVRLLAVTHTQRYMLTHTHTHTEGCAQPHTYTHTHTQNDTHTDRHTHTQESDVQLLLSQTIQKDAMDGRVHAHTLSEAILQTSAIVGERIEVANTGAVISASPSHEILAAYTHLPSPTVPNVGNRGAIVKLVSSKVLSDDTKALLQYTGKVLAMHAVSQTAPLTGHVCVDALHTQEFELSSLITQKFGGARIDNALEGRGVGDYLLALGSYCNSAITLTDVYCL